MRAAIVLAAGAGRRFGGPPKPLALRAGRSLLAHALDAARAAPAARVILVVGRQAARVAAAARAVAPDVTIVHARGWRQGHEHSLSAGVKALWPVERRAFVFLADMPAVPPGLARRLQRQGSPARASHRGKPGHPVLLDRAALARARAGTSLRGLPMAMLAADRRCRFDVDRRRRLNAAAPALMR